MIRDALTRALVLAERLVVAAETIGKELHKLNDTLDCLTFDQNGDTTLGAIERLLYDNLQTFDRHDREHGDSLAAHVARLADRIEDR